MGSFGAGTAPKTVLFWDKLLQKRSSFGPKLLQNDTVLDKTAPKTEPFLSGLWFLGSGFWFLVSGFLVLVSGFLFLVSGFWFLGSGFLVLGSWFWFLVRS